MFDITNSNFMGMNVIAYLQITTGIGLILFWIAYFTIGLAPKNPPVCYKEFERSFPVPDGILAIGLIVAGIGLLHGNSYAPSLSLVCSGALMFLGVIDLSFGIQNTFRQLSIRELLFSLSINGWCVCFGALILYEFM